MKSPAGLTGAPQLSLQAAIQTAQSPSVSFTRTRSGLPDPIHLNLAGPAGRIRSEPRSHGPAGFRPVTAPGHQLE